MAQTLSPAAWLEHLERRLDQRWTRMAVFDAYFEGDHRLAFATAKWNEAFGGLFASIADNWCPLVVDSAVERLGVQGFRFGAQQAADDQAWAIWQENGLDADSDLAHTEAVKLGESYWLVQPPAPGSDDAPRITVEHPSQVIVATAASDRRKRLAALKRWWDEDGFVYAFVYLPEGVAKYRSVERAMMGRRIQWTRYDSSPNPLGEVPIVPLRNNPSMLGGGQSDLKDAIPLQDALNKLLSDMLIGSEYQAFPQRVLLNVEIPKDPTTGRPLRSAELQASQSRLWAFESGTDGHEPKVSEFTAADLDNYVKSRQHLVRGLTAKTRTPPHYVLGEIVNASGDALKAAETGLVAKVRKKLAPFAEGHEDAMRLAFKAMGETEKASATDAEVIWRDPESRSFGELVDGLVKLATIGVPHEILWERAGFSPQEITRMKSLGIVDQLLNPQPPATVPADQGTSNGAVPTVA